MKKMLTTMLLIIAVTFIAYNNSSAANDTLVVYANGESLDKIITDDVTAEGAQAHKVYKLVSLDTTYLFLGPITVTSDFTIVGQLGSDGRPPCIQPGVLTGGSIPVELFLLNGAGTEVVIKNLYLLGQSTAGTHDWTSALKILADNVRLTVDNVIFEEWWLYSLGYSGNNPKFFITNCKFRNLAQPSWYSGEVLRNISNAYTDSVVMKYNTFFCVNGYAACPLTKKMVKYIDFSHNSLVWTFKNPFWFFNATDAKINDNVFYAAWSGGQSLTEYPWWDQLWSAEIGSVIDLDSLDLAKAAEFAPESASDPNLRWIAEAKRKVEVKNNVFFRPVEFNNFVKAWNDTATACSVITNNWMNARTLGMFADKTHWPGLVESGNLFVDPEYGSSINDVMYADKGNGIGFLKYFELIRTNATTTDYYGYQQTVVEQVADWVPKWPLPELADMQYSNPVMKSGGTDGLPIGDPGWFTGGYTTTAVESDTEIPNSFTLYEAYPNPFNPSTNIKFSLSEAGVISLRIYNVMGQLVKTITENEFRNAGEHMYSVNMNNITSGVYFYSLSQGEQHLTKKMVLIK